MKRAEIEARLAVLGRPDSVFAPLSALRANIAHKAAWDAEHPSEAKEHFELVEMLRVIAKDEELVERERRINEKLADWVASTGVGERSAAAAVTAKPTQALEAVQRWLAMEARRTWCVLLGRPGVGKSVAAAWMIREAVREGQTAAFRSASAVAKLSMFDAGADELAYLQRVRLLVLDDFGAEAPNEFAKAQFHQLLDARHEGGRRTLLTSNLARTEFRERIGPRLADRIGGDGMVHELSGPSLRRKETKPVGESRGGA